MKPERFNRTKSVVASSAIALVVAALVMGVSSLVIGPRSASPQHPGFDLTSNPSSFTITSAIYASPACSGAPALLYPGTTRCAVFSVHNLLSVPITVQSVSSALDVNFPAPPANCAPPAYFTLPTFSGSVTVGAGATAALPGVPIKLQESGHSQDNCQNYTYHFTYSGSAQYTDSTTTVLTSSPNPSALGQSVIFTATVTAGNPTTDTTTPSGTVNFYRCASATVCPNTGTPLGTGTIGAGGKATYSTTTSQLAQGLNYVDAVYPASGTNFTDSTSGVVTQDVAAGTTTALTSAPNPSTSGQSDTFTATVTKTGGTGTPTGSVTFYKGTPMTGIALGAPATVNPSTGKAVLSTSALAVGTDHVYAVYGGDTNFSTSTSPVLNQVVASAACITGTINGGYIVPAGQFICITGRVNGGITVKSGSGLYLNGATVNGGIVSTGATAFTSCGSTINGNITISQTTGPVLIGDGGDNQPTGDDPLPACATNTIRSNASLTNNTGAVEVGADMVTGSVTLTNNTNAVAPEVEANKITGSLACSGNVVAPTNDTLKNSVTGAKSGQCAGSAF